MAWEDFLNLITGEGVSAAVGFILSYLVEMWPGYAEFESRVKRLVFLIFCFAVPVLGTVAKCATGLAAWGDWTGAWWPAIVAAAVAFGAGHVAHMRKM